MGRGARIVIALTGAALAFAFVGIPLYVLPAHDAPREVDAVYVIGPPTDARIALAEGMIADGLADTLVVSLSDLERDRADAPAAVAVCAEPRDHPVVCAMPDPFTTRREARWLRDLAAERGWESVAIVTQTAHLTRTRVVVERCWPGDVAYVDSGEAFPLHLWAYQYLYQSAAFVKVALAHGC